jgi:hypothetical protein
MSSGFVLNGQAVQCNVAGKYTAHFLLMANMSQASTGPVWASIQHYRGTTQIVNWDNIQSAIGTGTYTQVDAVGEFDMQVGDLLYCAAQAPVAGTTVGGQTTFAIWPMGGPKGDTGPQGPDVTQAQSSYFYGQLSSGAGTANAQNVVTWSQVQNNGFTFSGPSTNITVTQAGRYRVAAQVSALPTATAGQNGSLRITQLNAATTVVAQRDTINPIGQTTSAWFTMFGEAVLNCAVGDIIQIFTNANVAYTTDSRSWVEITPVGGTKGDVGPQGPSVTQAQSSYAYLSTSNGNAALPANTQTTITWSAAAPPASFINNFTLQTSGSIIVASQAGLYRVLVEACIYASGGASPWTSVQLTHRDSGNNQIAQHNIAGPGTASGYNTFVAAEAQFNMAVGDYIVAQANSSVAATLDARTYISITPVGGTKGDTGPQGPDVTLLQSNYFMGGATQAGLGNDVQTPVAWITQRTNGFTLALSGQRITPALAGKYAVVCQLVYQALAASPYTRCVINHYNSAGTLLYQYAAVGNSITAANAYGQAVGDAILDMAVGDYFNVAAAISGGGTLQNTSYITVTPTGGTKGDTGPQGPPGTVGFVADGFMRRSGAGADIAIASSTVTALALNTVVSSQGSTYTPNAGNTAFTIPNAGVYDITAEVEITSAGVAAVWWAAISVNGNVVARTYGNGNSSATNAYDTVTISGQYSLNGADQVSLVVFGGAAFSVRYLATNNATDPISPYLSVWRAGSGPQGLQGIPGNSAGTTTWTAFPFGAGWQTYGSGYQACQYRQEGDLVRVRGLAAQTIAANGTIGTLPTGFRPPAPIIVNLMAAVTSQPAVAVRVDISAAGALNVATAAQPYAYLSFDGLAFSTVT